jgi:hypothetical protein
MRAILKRHRKPNTRGIAPVPDARAEKVTAATAAARGGLWATFKFVGEQAFSIPLHMHARWRARKVSAATPSRLCRRAYPSVCA